MEWGLLKSLFQPGWGKAEVCERCGKEFRCGATLSGCWCAEVQLTDAQREELKARYKGCVCRECLVRFSEKGSTQSAGSRM